MTAIKYSIHQIYSWVYRRKHTLSIYWELPLRQLKSIRFCQTGDTVDKWGCIIHLGYSLCFPSSVEVLHKLKGVTSLINKESSFTASKKYFTADSTSSGTVLQIIIEYLQFWHQLLSLTGEKKKIVAIKIYRETKCWVRFFETSFSENWKFLAS